MDLIRGSWKATRDGMVYEKKPKSQINDTSGLEKSCLDEVPITTRSDQTPLTLPQLKVEHTKTTIPKREKIKLPQLIVQKITPREKNHT